MANLKKNTCWPWPLLSYSPTWAVPGGTEISYTRGDRRSRETIVRGQPLGLENPVTVVPLGRCLPHPVPLPHPHSRLTLGYKVLA